MTADGNGAKDLLEPNHSSIDGNERVNENIVGDEQHMPKENGLTSNGDLSDLRDGLSGPAQNPAVQQQPPGATVHWERFLHLRSLKVLLVENDDSTRHVVSALLRNCSYEVIEASNALQAWKILEDLTNHIDLVLTEVSLPSLSGIVLLSKIMSHKTRKNVPVIMMSSHGSMGLVFKCLSKGAVDFLSSGSGSESGTQTQKSVRSKNIERSGNNSGSNDEDDNDSTGLNMEDGSDIGSGTQSSWTKQAAEIDSPQPPSSWNHVVECADSTCAQVIHSNAEISQNKQVPAITVGKCKELDEQPGNAVVGREIELGLAGNQTEHPMDVSLNTKGSKQNNPLEELDKAKLSLFSGSSSSKVKNETACLTGTIINTGSQTETREFEGPNRISSVSDINNTQSNNAENLPSVELSLKRLRAVKELGTTSKDDRNVLRRSDSSAFSRYNTNSNMQKSPSGTSGSGLPNENDLKAKEKDLGREKHSHSNVERPNQCSNWGSNNTDMGSTTNGPGAKFSLVRSNSVKASTVKCLHPSSLHPLQADMAFPPQQNAHEKTDERGGTTVAQVRGMQPKLQVQDLHHNHEKPVPSDHDDLSLKLLAAPAPHCGSSNLLGGPIEGNAGNYSVNGSASGSNHGSNGPNGSSVAANPGGMNMESDNGNAGKSGSTNASRSGSGSGGTENNRMEQSKFAQREAALTKFRQKRSERCFRKKVRYQSRKRLAEQRPRVRGQFVRKSADENTSEATSS
ncbi:hypothetical protein CDL15_Pgr001941 [Punica granatum]|uniref:Two-component response regulator-like APRR7 n=1 Tax=Punica granatum TaxID=22663 RepID=A0A218XBP7_PUNGR|nr:hypothetical protein CDL15_Pgr001941 [Punica granatum]PKI62180.1 hypothetical protein CRG98_017553 [Punica granatum]